MLCTAYSWWGFVFIHSALFQSEAEVWSQNALGTAILVYRRGSREIGEKNSWYLVLALKWRM